MDEEDDERFRCDWTEELNFNEKMYREHKDAFVTILSAFAEKCDIHLRTITAAKHRVETDPPNASPIHSAPHRTGPRAREFEKKEIEKKLSMNFIEPAHSERAAPIVFAPKKDGSLRFCVDCRQFNKIAVRDAYPIPSMDECIDSWGVAKVFSTLDANWRHLQIEIDQRNRDKTTFKSHHGIYRFIPIPFGLKNAPATFQC